MKPIKGTTDDCMTHLAKAIDGRDYLEKRKVIADFAGVGENAVRQWFNDDRQPVGEPLIRLRFYLEFLGYEVKEIEELPYDVRNAARLCGFGISTLTEIADLVGYTGKGRNAIDSVLQVFRGKRGAPSEKMKQFRSFVELYQDRLDEKKRKTVNVLVGSTADDRADQVSTLVPSRMRVIGESHSVIIQSLTANIKALTPMAEYVLSEAFTAEERQQIRTLAGDGVSRLSLLLTKLSGEAARSALAKQQ